MSASPRARLAGLPRRDEAEHQRRRERPRLGREVARRPDAHAALLAHLADDRLLEALARLDEAGQRGVAARRPARRAAEQQPVAVGDEHDHDRIGARVVVGAAARADRGRGRPRRRSGGAPQAAQKRVAAVPVEQRRGVGDEPALALREHGGRLAQADRPRAVALGAGRSAPLPRGSPPAISGAGSPPGAGASTSTANSGPTSSMPSRNGSLPSAPRASGTTARRSPSRTTPSRAGHHRARGGLRRCSATHAGSRRRSSPARSSRAPVNVFAPVTRTPA